MHSQAISGANKPGSTGFCGSINASEQEENIFEFSAKFMYNATSNENNLVLKGGARWKNSWLSANSYFQKEITMKKRILYGVANYEEIVAKNGYFIDKTQYIGRLEEIENPVFLRPRRFGKSLWCRILECYYSIHQKDRFEELFGNTWIGSNPTPLKNAFIVLHLDFSTVDYTGNLADIEDSFNFTCNFKMKTLIGLYRDWFQDRMEIDVKARGNDNLKNILSHVSLSDMPPLYVIIDEYDNFANQLITGRRDDVYKRLTADDSFLKTFFKTLKEGRKTGAIANVFITGVLPVTMDELASAYNIANFITLDESFENMLGFTQTEVNGLLDSICRDYDISPPQRQEIEAIIVNHYNGYHFVSPDIEAVFNPTLLAYFLDQFCRHRKFPEFLTDLNLRTDISWVQRITTAYPGSTEEFVESLVTQNTINYDRSGTDSGICNRAEGPVRRSQNQLACYLLLRQPGISGV